MIGSYLAGVGVGLATLSPSEWLIHKYLLHSPKEKRKWFNRSSSIGHNDIHHRAYTGPAHYYRDVTNENEVIHFDPGSVLAVLGGGAALGLGVNRLYSLIASRYASFDSSDLAFVMGVVTATGIGWIGYEISHHYMHVIGNRRLTINRLLGDLIQGGEKYRDGNLRYSKPLLDNVCNSIEAIVDKYVRKDIPKRFSFKSSLIDILDKQTDYNSNERGVRVTNVSMNEILDETAHKMLEREKEIRNPLSVIERGLYSLDRGLQRLFRGSQLFIGKYFRYIDNHHFIHHWSYKKNLNVFWMSSDNIFGTKVDSSTEKLESNRNYWLCPNSPDTTPFSLDR